MLRLAPAALIGALLIFVAAPTERLTAVDRLSELPTVDASRATYAVDAAHSNIGFRIRHMGIAMVEGEFGDYDGSIVYDPANLGATTVSASARTASIDTDVEARNNHLKSGDFFDAEQFPDIAFQSTGVQPTGPTSFRMSGNLTMKGVTKPVTFEVDAAGPVPAQQGMNRIGLHATTTINRRDFGIDYGNTLPGGFPAIADMVQIVLDVEGTSAQ